MKRSSGQLQLHMGCGEALTARLLLLRQRMVDSRCGRPKTAGSDAVRGKR